MQLEIFKTLIVMIYAMSLDMKEEQKFIVIMILKKRIKAKKFL